MSRRNKSLPILEHVTIEAVAAEGKCLFHWNDLVVFVPFCVPGDVRLLRRRADTTQEALFCRRRSYKTVGKESRSRRTFLPALRCLRRLQMAEPALRGAIEVQTAAGLRPASPHRKGGAARVPPHPWLSEDAGLPQQTGLRSFQPPLPYKRGNCIGT